MKTLCITGASPSDLSYIDGILTQGGMGLARSSKRDDNLTIEFWHTQVQSRNKELATEPGVVELGRVWEQLASDLFLANLDQPVWGWSSVQSLPLLDFWQSFDPQLRFVLVVTSAQRYIAHALDSGEPMPAVSVLMERWAAQHMQMLQFYHRFPNKTVLVDVDQCIENPVGLIKACQQAWGVELEKVHFPSLAALQFSTMTRFLASGLSQADDQWQALQSELWSSATPIGTPGGNAFDVDVSVAVDAYRDEKSNVDQALQASLHQQQEQSEKLQRAILAAQVEREHIQGERQQLQEALETTRTQLDVSTTAAETVQAEVAQLKKSLDTAQAELPTLRAESEALAREKEQLAAQLATKTTEYANLEKSSAQQNQQIQTLQSKHDEVTAQHKETQEEADLLLAQLHQVQEELETYFLKHQESEKQIKDSQANAAHIKKSLDAVQTELPPLKAKVEALAKEKDQLKAQLVNKTAEFEKLQKELQAAQAGLGAQKTQSSEFTKQLEALKAQLATKTTEHANLEKSSSQQNQQLKALQTQHDEVTAQFKETQEEADLLLAQLHQVQEELENYFLKYQDTKHEVEQADQRWKRMLQRIPDYFDLESAEIQAVTEATTDPTATDPNPANEPLLWRLKGLEAAGRLLPELEFKTSIEDGVAVLELPRRVGDQNLLLRWPAVAASDQTLIITATGNKTTVPKRVETLLQLSLSDWDLIQAIITALLKVLNAPGLLKRADGVSATNTPEALRALQERLAQIPTVFRFDTISLKRAQVNPDYEHLWLDFKNVLIGGKRMLDFDFRVSCANVRPKAFGQYPKLEFPETSGRAALSGWFDESYDDFGAKLELRFALPESMDLQVWEKLPAADRHFLSVLIHQIPTLLSELETAGASVKRGWTDWQQMAQTTSKILALRSTKQVAEPPVAPEKPKRAAPRAKRGSRS
ncbi:hypothetical protein [Zwartia sp.]|uniref:hypothetical protein n=1 Tax=Zwartia sp. TaxID=2978004 RepID=UPI00271DBCAD|nr:hypothetical protein [Zwartia sp.]MDO9024554.1 hypothetical protein [Zwartia sp.]